jgi:hypothetical protein
MTKTLCRSGIVLLLLSLVVGMLSSSALAAPSYFQGFETDTADWKGFAPAADPIRTQSGANDIIAASGDYYALAPNFLSSQSGSSFTFWGQTDQLSFPAGGFYTSVAIYLDVDGDWADDTEFNWESGLYSPDGFSSTAFVFNVGFYTSDNSTAAGSGNRFIIATSNDNDQDFDPGSAAGTKAAISQSGWYTFKHVFQSDSDDVLHVTMTILDAAGNPVPDAQWTMTDPSWVIEDTISGNGVGFFSSQAFSLLAFDNAIMGLGSGPADTAPPVTTGSAMSNGAAYTFGNWTSHAVTITLQPSDGTNGSGVASTMYSIDNGQAAAYTSEFTISTAGSHTVKYWSTDNAGNIEQTHTVEVKIDTTPPVTTASATSNGTTYTFGNWTTQPVMITLSPADGTGESGVASTYYTIDNGPETTYENPFSISADGSYTIQFWSTDVAGNAEQSTSVVVKIDSATPVTTVAATSDGAAYTFGAWAPEPVAITLTADDGTNGSGVAQTYYTIDGGQAATYGNPFTISTDGSHTLTYWSTDSAGNVETVHTAQVNVVSTTAGLIALVRQFEKNGRVAHLMIASLNWADLGARIHSAGIERAGLTVFLHHVVMERGRSLTIDQADTLMMLARHLYG